MATPILALTEWAAAQASPWLVENVAKRWLEFFAAGGGIEDRGLLDPTALTPSDGDAYLIDGTGAGDWTGHDGEIALYISGWAYKDPTEGMQLYVKDEDVRIIYDGANWDTPAGSSGGATEASASEIWTGSETGKFISPDKLFDAAAPITLASATNATAVNMATGINFNLPLDEDSEISNPSNAKPGQSGRIRVTDDGTGGWDLTFDTNWKFIGTDPTPITTTASEVHLFAYFVNTTTDIELSYLGALA